jgi:hypothetical protein
MGKKGRVRLLVSEQKRPKEVFMTPNILDVLSSQSHAPQIQTLASCNRSHFILLVGEGDFSFALGLALSLVHF